MYAKRPTWKHVFPSRYPSRYRGSSCLSKAPSSYIHVRRSGQIMPSTQSMRTHVDVNLELVKENENLRSGLLWMKMYISDIENSKVAMTPAKSKNIKKPATFISSVSKTMRKLNPFQQDSKDTSAV
ncbi:NPH3 domain, Root phototropism protein 2 [Artemisia annua]|uniref:NPH3 domain, Root phototropism protein 2 n=1 Tax=Artemisia annua TaxID=35608 RepID=A0A2U1KN57_ARTAN|nr:NPH3 domain, Root phototropism protein 2 [Artemisia annua]